MYTCSYVRAHVHAIVKYPIFLGSILAVDFKVCTVDIDGKKIKLQMWVRNASGPLPHLITKVLW